MGEEGTSIPRKDGKGILCFSNFFHYSLIFFSQVVAPVEAPVAVCVGEKEDSERKKEKKEKKKKRESTASRNAEAHVVKVQLVECSFEVKLVEYVSVE